MDPAAFTIGRLARETGCKVPTIRYYEEIGLLPTPRRSPGNQRLYGPAHVARLAFIRHCRALGFVLAEIRELLRLRDHPETSCAEVTAIARLHLDEIQQRIDRLTALRAELQEILETCKGGRVEQCRIIEALSAYSPAEPAAARR